MGGAVRRVEVLGCGGMGDRGLFGRYRVTARHDFRVAGSRIDGHMRRDLGAMDDGAVGLSGRSRRRAGCCRIVRHIRHLRLVGVLIAGSGSDTVGTPPHDCNSSYECGTQSDDL